MSVQTKKGLLEYCVLKILVVEPSYVYKMIEDLRNVINISESTLYSVVRRLSDGGFLQAVTKEHNGRIRRYYTMTDAGIGKLSSFTDEGQDLQKILQFILIQ